MPDEAPDVAPNVAPDALELRGVTKRFGATTALDGASLRVRAGTLHAVLGENGAGKTTLMRVAFGLVHADAGDVLIDGVSRRLATPADAIAAGVGMVHQHFTNVPAMSVAENVALGGRGRYDARRAVARVREIGERTGLVLDPGAAAGSLGVAAQQRLEIVKALARDPESGSGQGTRTLILDEPTAVLTPAESRELMTWLRGFVASGHSAVLVTHRLRDAIAYADDVTVLRRGRTVGALPAAEATESGLAELVLGERPPAVPDRRASAPGNVVARAVDLRVTDASGVERVRGATLELRGGEIVGLAAVDGAGQHELLAALAGRAGSTSGTLERPPRVGFIPEDRHRDALLLDASLAENVALHGAGSRRGLMPWRDLGRRTAELIERFDVRGGNGGTPAHALSGGNQQKLVVARELTPDPSLAAEIRESGPMLIVAENPTRGLDVRASAAIHERLREARDAGAAVIVHSTDLDEVLQLADRVVAMYGGRVTAVAADRETVGRAMLGASPAEPG